MQFEHILSPLLHINVKHSIRSPSIDHSPEHERAPDGGEEASPIVVDGEKRRRDFDGEKDAADGRRKRTRHAHRARRRQHLRLRVGVEGVKGEDEEEKSQINQLAQF